MSNPRRTRLIAVILVSVCMATPYWIKITPFASIPSKSAVGKLNLTRNGTVLEVRFVAPERLSSVSMRLPNEVLGSDDHAGHPVFPIAVRLRVKDEFGTNIWDELVEPVRMQWTNWHPSPSLVLSIQSWLSERLVTNRVYVLTLTVEKEVEGLGEAEIYLHWMDHAYLWGSKRQTLTIVPAK